MPDLNLGNENVDLNRSRFYWKIEFVRQDDGSNDVYANAFFRDTTTLAGGVSSGSVIAQHSFILTVPDEHAKVTGFGPFFNNFLSMCNNAMSGYYTSGSVALESGSLNKLDQF